MIEQKTIRKEIRLEGVGVHSGKSVHLVLKPSDGGEIMFRRTDLGNLESPIEPGRIESRNSTTLVGDKFRVQTVEHLVAALYAFGVNSLIIELDADEVPIMDGSALPFVRALEQAGEQGLSRKIPALKILKSFAVEEKGASIVVEPADKADKMEGLRLSYTIEYPHPSIGRQSLSLTFRQEIFARDIAPARTFGFIRDVEMLHSQGLALGASFENTVVLDDEKVMNPPLRFPDEFVRHKLLDIAGDLALLGRPLLGRITAHRAGHRLHFQVVQFLAASPDFWEEV
jgi:UDP-3-O-[3-hydroxymyristoyl] N-acetylglucosamine deacetylase